VELEDLDGKERVALLALLQRVLGGDGRVSDEERAEIAHLVEAFGQDGYRRAFDEAGRRFGDTEELKRFLAEVGRPEARELIMGELLEAAIPGAVEGHASEFVDWLSDAWGIETRYEGEPPG
jgi:uncharacterized tellurite resistance protein B-like protein